MIHYYINYPCFDALKWFHFPNSTQLLTQRIRYLNFKKKPLLECIIYNCIKCCIISDRIRGPSKPKVIVSQETESGGSFVGGSLSAINSHQRGMALLVFLSLLLEYICYIHYTRIH